MYKKIRALVWEECRVGGTIAAACVAAALTYMIVYSNQIGARDWTSDDALLTPVVLGVPLLSALLLILNPSYTGHMAGGYSRHILRLPIPTSIAVAVSLAGRTLFVAAATFVIFAASHVLFGNEPNLAFIMLVVLIYLAVQLLDWLREPVSGLSSLLILSVFACVLVPVLLLGTLGDLGEFAIRNFLQQFQGVEIVAKPGITPAVMVGALVSAYGLSVLAVHAARVGWRTGIPEIWEWPRRLDVGRVVTAPKFRSPIAAQVWYELRRSGIVMPSAAIGVCLLGATAITVLEQSTPSELRQAPLNLYLSLLPFPALAIGAAAHGIYTTIVGIRRQKGQPGFPYLKPLTSAEYARVQTIVNAVLLAPLVVAAVVLHVALAGGQFVREVLGFAYETGAGNVREIVWVVIGRGVLLAMIAWPLTVIGTRMIMVMVSAIVVIFVISAGVGVHIFAGDVVVQAMWLTLAAIFVLCAGAYWRAWRLHVISGRPVLAWGCAWLLTGWLLRGALPSGLSANGTTPSEIVLEIAMCLGYASLVPLPFIAIALDVAYRRHGKPVTQDTEQHRRRSAPRSMGMTVAAGLGVLAIVWLGWPAKPAYLAYLRSIGWPATLEELDASYAEVPENENAALRYLAIHREIAGVRKAFYVDEEKRQRTASAKPLSPRQVDDSLFGVGSAKPPHTGPINEYDWAASERYWAEVTARIAPELERIAAEGPHASRYPIDLRKGVYLELPHLAELRVLSRELYLDAIHWSVLNDPQKAQDAALAILSLQESLANEPLLLSQLNRISILTTGIHALECVVNRAALTDADLARLQDRYAHVLPPATEHRILDSAMRGECATYVAYVGTVFSNQLISGKSSYKSVQPFWIPNGLVLPPSAEQMHLLCYYSKIMDSPMSKGTWNVDDLMDSASTFVFAPIGTLLTPGMERAYDAEWRIRMQLNIAVAGIAAERFRRAEGRFPEKLRDLVPAYIDAVPTDFYAQDRSVDYFHMDDGSIVIYSVGRNSRNVHGRAPVEERGVESCAFYVCPRGPVPEAS